MPKWARAPGSPDATWGDFDGDGRGDLLVLGMNSGFPLNYRYLRGAGVTEAFTSMLGFTRDINTRGEIIRTRDLDGDGRSDLLIWAELWTHVPVMGFGWTITGSLTVLNPWDVTKDTRLEKCVWERVPGEVLDFGVFGDVNGDGIDEIGARCVPMENALAPTPFDHMPTAIGDVNGDGFADAAEASSGIWFGGPKGLPSAPSVSPGDGAKLLEVGDVNGDGFADALEVTTTATTWAIRPGSSTGLRGGTDRILSPVAPCGVKTPVRANDIDGDGYADLLAMRTDGLGVVLFHGGPSGFSRVSNITMPDGSANISNVVAGVDYDADGHADVAVATTDLRVFVFFGTSAGLPAAPTRTIALSDLGLSRADTDRLFVY